MFLEQGVKLSLLCIFNNLQKKKKKKKKKKIFYAKAKK